MHNKIMMLLSFAKWLSPVVFVYILVVGHPVLANQNCANLFEVTVSSKSTESSLWQYGASDQQIHHKSITRERVTDFLRDQADIAEGDVLIHPETKEVWMGHPANKSYPIQLGDLSFKQWLNLLNQADKKAKIDIKDPKVIPEVIKIVRQSGISESNLIFHADVLKGDGAHNPIFSMNDLITIRTNFPNTIISLGITNSPRTQSLTNSMVDEYVRVAKKLGGKITFSVVATHITPYAIKKLSKLDRGWNIYYWNTDNHNVSFQTAKLLSRITPHAFIDLWREGIPLTQKRTNLIPKSAKKLAINFNELMQIISEPPTSTPLNRRETAPVIVMDLDGTLWRSNGLGPWIVGLAKEKGLLNAEATKEPMRKLFEFFGRKPSGDVEVDFINAWQIFLDWTVGKTENQIIEGTRMMEAMYGWILAGTHVNQVHRLVDESIDKYKIHFRVFSGIPRFIDRARRNGWDLVLISTSPEPILQRFAERIFDLKADQVFGTKVQIDNQGIIQNRVDRVTYREGKVEALDEFINRHYDSSPTKAYLVMGDSANYTGGDHLMLQRGEIAIVPEYSQSGVNGAIELSNRGFNLKILKLP